MKTLPAVPAAAVIIAGMVFAGTSAHAAGNNYASLKSNTAGMAVNNDADVKACTEAGNRVVTGRDGKRTCQAPVEQPDRAVAAPKPATAGQH